MIFNDKERLWVERYRPTVISDCVLPKNVKEAFGGFLKSNDMPNMILHGGAGTGKTTAAKALCEELGYDWMLINTSTDRNIDTIRTTIMQYASTRTMDGKLKVVILDEADGMNPQSFQPAMRGVIEDFSKTCRFIFTCNYPHRIIDPLHSRCTVLSYDIPKSEKMTLAAAFMKRIFAILDNEKVQYDKKPVAELIMKHFPDFRRVINELQRYANINGKIDESVLQSGKAYSIKDLTASLKDKDFKAVRQWAVDHIADRDSNLIFRELYDSLYDFIEQSYIPITILLINKYQYQGVTCPDPEINFVSCMIDIMEEVKFK